jgi:hypothetical protein
MLTRGRVVLVTGGTAALLLSSTAPVAADGWGTVDCDQAPTPQCQLEVGDTASAPAPPQPSTADESAEYGSADGQDDGQNAASCGYRPSSYQAPAGAVGSGLLPSAAWYDGLCTTTGVITNPVQVAARTPAGIARLAYDQLGLPQPDIAASPRTDQLVNLPTWLWLDGGWDAVTATAHVPGVSITATARPRTVTWTMGDGGTVTCPGPGTAFRSGANPRAASPDCGYTYRRSSAAQPAHAFRVTATVYWSVRWAGAGQTGTFPELTTSSSTTFRVAESQALNIPPVPH